MKIAFFCVDNYGKIIGEELIERGYDVEFNKLSEGVDITFVFGVMAAYNFNAYLQQKYETERFVYKGKISPVVFDLPVWRFGNETWDKYYGLYKTMIQTWGNCTTISEFTTNQVKDIWNIDSVPLFSVFNDKLIDKYKVKADRKKQIIMVSRFEPHKRFEVVMNAIVDTDWKLVMCGRGGSQTKQYDDLAKSLGIDYEMYINPSDKFIVQQYCESQVCIQPSVFEGLSLVPKEALWCDTPVIVADIPINREFHADFVNYFKPNDVDDLKKVLKTELKLAQKEHIKKLTIKEVTNGVEKWIKNL